MQQKEGYIPGFFSRIARAILPAAEAGPIAVVPGGIPQRVAGLYLRSANKSLDALMTYPIANPAEFHLVRFSLTGLFACNEIDHILARQKEKDKLKDAVTATIQQINTDFLKMKNVPESQTQTLLNDAETDAKEIMARYQHNF